MSVRERENERASERASESKSEREQDRARERERGRERKYERERGEGERKMRGRASQRVTSGKAGRAIERGRRPNL